MAVEETRDKGQYHFHYDRSERLAGKPDPAEKRPKSIFKRNRSLTIVLLDIVIIVIMFLLFQFVFTPGRGHARVGDFRADLSAFRFEGEVYATLEVTRTRAGETPLSGAESLVEIRFEGRDAILDTLPVSVDSSIKATTVLPDDGTDDGPAVKVDVVLLGRTLSLVARPSR